MQIETQKVYSIYAGCSNLSLHSAIHAPPELPAIASLSSAALQSCMKAADIAHLHTVAQGLPLFHFAQKFLPCIFTKVIFFGGEDFNLLGRSANSVLVLWQNAYTILLH